jgi:hypothetical protein
MSLQNNPSHTNMENHQLEADLRSNKFTRVLKSQTSVGRSYSFILQLKRFSFALFWIQNRLVLTATVIIQYDFSCRKWGVNFW